MSSLVTKVFLEDREYRRLLEIEKRYNALLHERKVQGGGGGQCVCQDRRPVSLSQVNAEAEKEEGLGRPPSPSVLPSITTPPQAQVETNTALLDSKKLPWYFLGPKKYQVPGEDAGK